MVASLLPVAALIVCKELKAVDPFRTLPCVELGDYEANRASVILREGLSVPGVREEDILIDQVCHREVRRVLAVSVDHYVSRG